MTTTLRPADDLVRRLRQATVWAYVGDEGRLVVRRLDDLSPTERAAILAWLRAHAAELHRREHDDRIASIWHGAAPHDVMLVVAALGQTEPEQWLERTPLVRRLARLVAEHDAVPARIGPLPAPERPAARRRSWWRW